MTGGLRQRIFGEGGQLREEPCTLPFPSGSIDVLVRELSGKAAKEFEQAVVRGTDAPLGMLLQISLVDPETKELIFEPADRAQLEELPLSAVRPALVICNELLGVDLEKVKANLGLVRSTE